MLRAARAGAAAVLAVAVTLSACGEPAGDDDVDSSQPVGANVRFRLWDEAAASAYQESFDAFNAIHRDIHVEVEVEPVATYADRAVRDLATGTMADVFWVPSDAATEWVDRSDLLEPSVTEDWEPAVTELFTRDGELWAVPQLWETSALFVNTELLEDAGVDAAGLAWDPAAPATEAAEKAAEEAAAEAAGGQAADDAGAAADGPADTAAAAQAPSDEPGTTGVAPGDDAPEDAGPPAEDDPHDDAPTGEEVPAPHADTLREAVRSLTRDAEGRDPRDPEFDDGAVVQFGFNLDLTAPPVWLAFLAQGTPTGEDVILTDDEAAAAAFTYLLALPAVPAPEDLTDRELFTEGRLALFQSTSADLRHVAEHAEATWAVAPAPTGPAGAVSVVSGIGAAANAHSPHPEATAEVLAWLASTDGQSALASHSVGIPAAHGAQELFARAWADRGLETTALLDPAVVVTLPSGARTIEALRAVAPVLTQLFDGELTVAEALPAAQRAAESVE